MLTFFVFLPALNHEFVNFDDNLYVTSNPWVQAGLKTESLKWAFTSTWAGNWYPLTWICHMLDAELFGMDAGMHQLGNIFFSYCKYALSISDSQWHNACHLEKRLCCSSICFTSPARGVRSLGI